MNPVKNNQIATEAAMKESDQENRRVRTCAECDFFGDYDKIISGPWEPVPDSGGKFYRTPFMGFDESAGAVCAFRRSGTKRRVYDKSEVCSDFKPRAWARPEHCRDCDRKHGEMNDGSVLCDGWPYYRKEGDAGCQNGKIAFDKNLSLF